MKINPVGIRVLGAFLVLVLAFYPLCAADTLYVNRTTGNDEAAAADETRATRFQSIQAAVNAAQDGATVLVEPGIYDNNVGVDTKNSTNRVWITGKTITLRSTEGAAKTHIVGRWDNTPVVSTNGCGAMQIRCVCVNSSALGTVIEGFTLRDGATRIDRTANGSLNDDIPQLGGGLAVYSSKKEVYLVDCVVSNCTAVWGGAMRGGTAVRCLITENHAFSNPAGARQANLYSCILSRHVGSPASAYVTAVNCTFAENNGDAQVTGYNCLFAANPNYNGTHADCVYEKSSGPQLFAPLERDCRLLSGSVASTAGDPQYHTGVFDYLPEEYEGKDFNGSAFPVNADGSTVAGAVGTSAVPVHGGLYFDHKVHYDGQYIPASGSYAFYDEWPKQVRVVPVTASGKKFFRYRVTWAEEGFGVTSRWAQRDGSLVLSAPYTSRMLMTNALYSANKELWVDAGYEGDDSDGSEEKPYAVIQEAIDTLVADDCAIINLAEGDYDRGGKVYGSQSITNRVVVDGNFSVLIKGTGDPAKTVIRGKADHETSQHEKDYPGCGPAAVRCVFLPKSSFPCAVQGVTLADGHSNCADYSKDNESDRAGAIGGVHLTSTHCVTHQLLDSVITNCGSVRAAVYSMWLSRCRIYDCQSYGGVVRYSQLSSVFVAGSNRIGSNSLGAQRNHVLGNAVTSCHLTYESPPELAGAYYGFHLAGMMEEHPLDSKCAYYGTVVGKNLSSFAAGDVGAVEAALMPVDADNGDWRPLSVSPALTAGTFADDGSDDYDDAMIFYGAFLTSDMDGKPIVFNADGTPRPGAWQTPVPGISVAESGGSLSVNSSVDAFADVMPESVTVKLAKGTRPVSGFTVNGGKPCLFSEKAEWSIDTEGMDKLAIEPLLSADWYVDAENGDDSADGFTPDTAKRTFHGEDGVMKHVISGDCVHAAPGFYDEGYAVPTGFLRRRLVVPAGVTVVADQGPEKTFIVGAAATESGVEGYEVDEYGRGTNAVACVYLEATDPETPSVVKGFTLTGGRTHYYYGKSVTSGYWSDNSVGGAALAPQSYDPAFASRIEDCIVSNNAATRGGAFFSVNGVRCRIYENFGVNGPAAANSFLQGCIVDRNCGQNTIGSPRAVWNCTIGPDNYLESGASLNVINDSYGAFGGVVNTLCLGLVGGVTNAVNSVFLKTANIDVDGDPRLVNCLECEAEDIAVDPLTYAPLPGTAHPALDAGDPSLGAHDWYGDTDVWGNQRVWNGRMDIGAVEADWRDRYAAGVSGSRKFSVVKATAGVTETEGGKVRIADGEELVAEWVNRSLRMARYSLAFDVTGNGTVSLVVNGETTVCSGSGKSFVHTFDSASELNEIAIGYEGDDCGYVTLVSCSRACGTLISIR